MVDRQAGITIPVLLVGPRFGIRENPIPTDGYRRAPKIRARRRTDGGTKGRLPNQSGPGKCSGRNATATLRALFTIGNDIGLCRFAKCDCGLTLTWSNVTIRTRNCAFKRRDWLLANLGPSFPRNTSDRFTDFGHRFPQPRKINDHQPSKTDTTF